jgi:hypothetical protein
MFAKVKYTAVSGVTAAAVIWLTGCGGDSPVTAVKTLDSAFAHPGEGISAEDADRNKALVEMALAASKSNDLVTAASSLQALRASRSMTVDQHMAVQDAMSSFQANLAQRADHGDPAARAALDSLRGGHAR